MKTHDATDEPLVEKESGGSQGEGESGREIGSKVLWTPATKQCPPTLLKEQSVPYQNKSDKEV